MMMDGVTSTATYAEIPHDLLREIMSRLPGKSVVRFNCVSKLWSYSLTVTAFLLSHSRSSLSASASHDLYYAFCYSDPEEPLSKGTLQLFSFHVHNDEKISNDKNDYNADTPAVKMIPVPLPALPRVFAPKFLTVSNFCDGLVCVFNWRDPSQRLPVLLCSSRIRDFSVLPTTSLCLPTPPHDLSRLHWCLLGFDPTRGEYRILRSINREGATRRVFYCEYEILTVGSKSWKPIDHANVPPSIRTQGFTLPSRGSFCLNGAIYWLHFKEPKDMIVASIDLATEEFQAFNVNQLSGHAYSYDYNYSLMPLNGNPTLFVSEMMCNNAWQWTFSDHKNLNPVCSRRILPSHINSSIQNLSFPKVSSTMFRRRLDYRRLL